MSAFVIRRIFYSVPTVFGVALLLFLLLNVVGGDPTLRMVGKHGTEQQIVELRRELGLDQPLYFQFAIFLKQIVTFDFGRSYATHQEITEMIAQGIGPSLSLSVLAFLMTLIVSLSLAVLISYFRGRWVDRVMQIFCVMGMSITSLAFILAGQYFLAYRWGWFPISGYEPGFPDFIEYVMLPALIWTCVGVGSDVRFFRTAILDESNQDYVRTARAKGLAESVVFFKHILKNSLVPIITFTIIQIPFLITGAFLLERFLGIPGLGSITIDAFNNSDFPVLKAMTVLFSILFIVGQLATDIMYRVVDPRVTLR